MGDYGEYKLHDDYDNYSLFKNLSSEDKSSLVGKLAGKYIDFLKKGETSNEVVVRVTAVGDQLHEQQLSMQYAFQSEQKYGGGRTLGERVRLEECLGPIQEKTKGAAEGKVTPPPIPKRMDLEPLEKENKIDVQKPLEKEIILNTKEQKQVDKIIGQLRKNKSPFEVLKKRELSGAQIQSLKGNTFVQIKIKAYAAKNEKKFIEEKNKNPEAFSKVLAIMSQPTAQSLTETKLL